MVLQKETIKTQLRYERVSFNKIEQHYNVQGPYQWKHMFVNRGTWYTTERI